MIDNLESNPLRENIESEAIKRLEYFSLIKPKDKLLILAVYLDLKPMSAFTFMVDKDDDLKNKIDQIKNIVEDLNLFFKINHTTHKGNGRNPKIPSIDIFVSKNKKSLDNVSMDSKERNRLGSEEYDKRLGEYFGFPKTAVLGFVTGESFDSNAKDFPSEISEEDKKFMFFALSRDNWREEIKWLRKVEAEIKVLSPAIYEQVMNEKK